MLRCPPVKLEERVEDGENARNPGTEGEGEESCHWHLL